MGRLNNSLVSNDERALLSRGYTIQNTLGEGSYSKVKSATWKKDSTERGVALKIINRTTAPKDFLEKFWPRECEIMEKVKHENIIRMYEVFTEGHKIYMALERAGHGDLLEYIRMKGSLSDFKTNKYFAEMCSGLKYLHDLNIIHRDLKCENILLTLDDVVKIADFGFGRTLVPEELGTTYCGSAAYAAPEVLRGIPYQGPVPDIWSIGVILFIMGCGVMPYRDSSIRQLMQDQQKMPSFPKADTLNEGFKKLVTNILCFNLSKRYKLARIMKDDWLLTIPKNKLQTCLSATDSGLGSDISSSSAASSRR